MKLRERVAPSGLVVLAGAMLVALAYGVLPATSEGTFAIPDDVEWSGDGVRYTYAWRSLATPRLLGPRWEQHGEVRSDPAGQPVDRSTRTVVPGEDGTCLVVDGEPAGSCPEDVDVLLEFEVAHASGTSSPLIHHNVLGSASSSAVASAPSVIGMQWERHARELALRPEDVALVHSVGKKTCAEWGYECEQLGAVDWEIVRLIHVPTRLQIYERESLDDVVVTEYRVHELAISERS